MVAVGAQATAHLYALLADIALLAVARPPTVQPASTLAPLACQVTVPQRARSEIIALLAVQRPTRVHQANMYACVRACVQYWLYAHAKGVLVQGSTTGLTTSACTGSCPIGAHALCFVCAS